MKRKSNTIAPRYKRPRPEGCWSECGKECWREQLGLCLTEDQLHRHDLLPPNEYATSIRELRYGRRDYDAEIIAYGKAITAWHAKGEKGDRPQDWRIAVRDPHANTPIWKYPGPKDYTFGYDLYTLWEPEVLEACLFADENYVKAVHAAGKNGFASLTDISRAIRRVFATTFCEAMRTWWEERHAKWVALLAISPNRKPWLEAIPSTFDFHWKLAFDLFGDASLLVAQWSAMSYANYQDSWASLLVTHMGDEMKAQWAARISNYAKQEAYDLGHKAKLKKFQPSTQSVLPVQESSHDRQQPAIPGAADTPVSPKLLIPRKRFGS